MKFLRLVGVFVSLITVLPAIGTAKIKVESEEDLPRFTYKVEGSLSDLVQSDADFAAFAALVRSDIESVLEEYEIGDATTLKDYYGTLLALQMLNGEYDRALETIEGIRELEEKPAPKVLTGLVFQSWIEASRSGAAAGSEEFAAAFRQAYSQALEPLPWDVVQDAVERAKGSWEIRSWNLLLGIMESQLQPAVDKTGSVSGDIAENLIAFRMLRDLLLPLKGEAVEALSAYIDANRVEKDDIWAQRSIELDAGADAQPVIVAVWDSGIDTAIYPDQLFTNLKESLDGQDNDGNGFVDDVHGIAYTLHADKSPDMLLPLDDETRARYPEMKAMVKGLTDMQAAIDSPEATELKKQLSELAPEDVKPFIEDISLFGNYAHGTHVGGIAAVGNPFARLMIARITFDHRMIPETPTVEQARKDVKASQEVIDYFKANGVRVVNMSWGGSQNDFEMALELNGVGETAEERLAMAQEIFSIFREGLMAVFASAPDILFVTSAGNSDNDAEFDLMIPSSFDLSNIVTVGAVDQAGEETSFTTFGSNVDVHANGFEVESYVPGGDRMPLSGTSMSSPNVANLAAKLLALAPDLSPQEVIELMKQGADTSADGRRVLINPKATIALLEQGKS